MNLTQISIKSEASYIPHVFEDEIPKEQVNSEGTEHLILKFSNFANVKFRQYLGTHD